MKRLIVPLSLLVSAGLANATSHKSRGPVNSVRQTTTVKQTTVVKYGGNSRGPVARPAARGPIVLPGAPRGPMGPGMPYPAPGGPRPGYPGGGMFPGGPGGGGCGLMSQCGPRFPGQGMLAPAILPPMGGQRPMLPGMPGGMPGMPGMPGGQQPMPYPAPGMGMAGMPPGMMQQPFQQLNPFGMNPMGMNQMGMNPMGMNQNPFGNNFSSEPSYERPSQSRPRRHTSVAAETQFNFGDDDTAGLGSHQTQETKLTKKDKEEKEEGTEETKNPEVAQPEEVDALETVTDAQRLAEADATIWPQFRANLNACAKACDPIGHSLTTLDKDEKDCKRQSLNGINLPGLRCTIDGKKRIIKASNSSDRPFFTSLNDCMAKQGSKLDVKSLDTDKKEVIDLTASIALIQYAPVCSVQQPTTTPEVAPAAPAVTAQRTNPQEGQAPHTIR